MLFRSLHSSGTFRMLQQTLYLGLALFHATLANQVGTRGAECCKFTLASKAPFPCDAGQLEDGQIRLNGSYPTTEFCLDQQSGGITDDSGLGCIVTEAPNTQVQCDHGKPPTPGFSIGADHTLLYHGSPSFFACPATDTEYNIYVSPDFGQTKCFPITLEAKGSCGPPPPPPPTSTSCPAPSPPVTMWQTQMVTEMVNHTVTSTHTKWMSCSNITTSATPTAPVPSSRNQTTGCLRCGKTEKSTATDSSTWVATTLATVSAARTTT